LVPEIVQRAEGERSSFVIVPTPSPSAIWAPEAPVSLTLVPGARPRAAAHGRPAPACCARRQRRLFAPLADPPRRYELKNLSPVKSPTLTPGHEPPGPGVELNRTQSRRRSCHLADSATVSIVVPRRETVKQNWRSGLEAVAKPPTHVWRRRICADAASSVGVIVSHYCSLQVPKAPCERKARDPCPA
jgi:hypothetical protein